MLQFVARAPELVRAAAPGAESSPDLQFVAEVIVSLAKMIGALKELSRLHQRDDTAWHISAQFTAELQRVIATHLENDNSINDRYS